MQRGGIGRARLLVAGLASATLGVVAGPTDAVSEAETVTSSFVADADARVNEARPASNYGTSHLRTDGGTDPDVHSYLRFTVTGLGADVVRATLRVHVYGGTKTGFTVAGTTTAWSEGTITWSNRPAATSDDLASSGRVAAGAWAELDVTPLVTGDGQYAFVLRTSSTDGADLNSREASPSVRPHLMVEVDPMTAPQSTAAPQILGLPREGETLTATAGTWSGSAPITYAYQWRRCDAAGDACAAIAGASASSRQVAAEDVAGTLRVVVTATNGIGTSSATSAPTGVVEPSSSDAPVIAGAGNIAACDHDRDEATAQLIDGLDPAVVFTLGDNVYPSGTAAEFADCYAPTWGRHLTRTRPAPGNHDYDTPGAAGYFRYFGAAAGDPALGYYAYDLEAWRLYVLNTNCAVVACGAGSAQEQWLRADLAANPRACTAVFGHEPRFSSAADPEHRDDLAVAALYAAYHEAGGDLWVAAHVHHYERLTRLAPDGTIDTATGVRVFVAGTGGAGVTEPGPATIGSEVRAATNGILALTLGSGAYGWQFLRTGGSVLDAGTDTCRGPSIDSSAPSSPTGLVASQGGAARVDLGWVAAIDDVGVVGHEIRRDGTLVATTTGDAWWTDEDVVTGATYVYDVTALDAAGNRSQPSAPASVTVGPSASTVVLAPADDARVSEARPSSNYGASHLRTDGGSDPDIESYLRFDVSTGGRPVLSARLRLRTFGASADGFEVRGSASTWAETTITWANRPATGGPVYATSGRVLTETWVELDVSAAVTGSGAVSFALASLSDDGVEIYSREAADPAARPELVLVLG